MITQMTEQCADAQVRYAHQDGGDIFLLHAFDDFGDIVTGFGFGKFTQEVVAAYADNHKLGLALQQRGQARQGLCGGIAENAAIDDVPIGQLLQLRGIGFVRVCAVAVGKRVAQSQYGTSCGNFRLLLAGFTAASCKQ